jgi:1,4-alpha-glucan branching enzyme
MHLKRCLALSIGVAFSLAVRAAVITAGVDDEIDQTFKYSDTNAMTVGVAGEFSNWKELPMLKDGVGNWSRTVHVKRGYYGYKFVVNGEWVLDPNSSARKTINGVENSAFAAGEVAPTATNETLSTKIPVTFSYIDANATSVHLAGDFNNWADNMDGKVTGHSDWLLKSDGSGNWTLTAPLAPGKYKFKYVIDGGARWEKDARLPVTADDNSLIEVKADGGEVVHAAPGGSGSVFLYSDGRATTVYVAGDFNNWLDNVDGKVTGHGEWLLQNDGSGNWKLTAQLPPGRHKFKYVVDGGVRWETDARLPMAIDGNSVIDVASSAKVSTNAAAASASSSGTTFTYADSTAKTVFIAGEFNQWSATANSMQKDPSGLWTADIPLKAGKYQYKFVVDGVWKTDPSNPDAADDSYGGRNSVKSVGP